MALKGKTIWVITDAKAGNRNQCLGVCDALGVTPEIKELAERPFGRMFGLLKPLWRVTNLPQAPWPDMVIGAGTLSIPVVQMIKRRSPHTFTVQLMNPRCDLSLFDVVAIPRHDNPPEAPNVVTTLGAVHRVTSARLKDEYKKWISPFADYKGLKVAVLVGGNSKRYTFDEVKATQYAKELMHFAAMNKANLFITTSRRTGDVQTKILRSYLKGPHIYFWRGKGQNPYFGMLAHADAIIAPADSVSMLSEASATGKPVYVYDLNRHWGKKFGHLHQSLAAAGYIKPFSAGVKGLFTSPATPLNDSARVAACVRQKLVLFYVFYK